MSVLTARPITRWLVPVGAAAAVLGGGLAIGALTAAADPTLPPRDAEQLLVDLQSAQVDGVSGTVVQRSDLGLPALGGGSGSAELASLAAGTHTLRVWYASPDKARVALLGTLGETDVITNGTDVWVWSSRENSATHGALPWSRLPAGTQPLPTVSAGGMLAGLTPQQLAKAALKALDPSTKVSTSGTVHIAGRDAYELVLSPRDPASLVGSVRLAVDAVEHVPLRVQLFARSAATPAFEVAFTQITFARPDPAQFDFNPPPGAKVIEGGHADLPGTDGKPDAGPKQERPKLAVVGRGWTSVLVAALPEGTPGEPTDGPWAFVERLPVVSGDWGRGHLLTSSLFNILITDDGRVLAGAVRPDRLYQAAADPTAAPR